MPISGNELLILLVLAAVVIGPQRLPRYAEQLASLVRNARRLLAGAKSQIQTELGPDFEDVDWRQYDPRRYDPRRIVREALLEDLPPVARQPGGRDGSAQPPEPVAHDVPVTPTASGRGGVESARFSDAPASAQGAPSADVAPAEPDVTAVAPFDDDAT